MASRNIVRKFRNSRLLKNYGSWLYCNNCNKTVAYICYTTYKGIKISFTCECGNDGEIELLENSYQLPINKELAKSLILIDNRFCCPNDIAPLFSVVSKQVTKFEYQATCLKCDEVFYGEG